jgi:integrase/recombinase XerD
MRTGNRPFTYSKPVQRFASRSTSAGAPGDMHGLFAAMRRHLEHRAVLGTPPRALVQLERYERDFIDWAESRGITHPQQVSRQVLERYQRFLHHYRKKNGEPLSIVSQKSKLAPVRSLFKWLTRQGEIPANPAADLDFPRQIHRIPRHVLSADEAERVLAVPELDTLSGLRDRAMLEVLYATGVRRAELARLACNDVDWDRGLLLVREGKGGKDRLIPMGARALHWVRHYVDEVRPRLAWNANERMLFLGQEGQALGLEQVSSRMVAYVKASGVGKPGGCHLLRHTMATLMLEGGAELRFIQAMLGHSNLSTTQIYTHVAVGQLARVHAASHPGVALRQRGEDAQSAEQPTLHPTPGPGPQNVSEAPSEADRAALWAALEREAAEDREEIGP